MRLGFPILLSGDGSRQSFERTPPVDLLTRLRGYQFFIRDRLPSISCVTTLKVALVLLDQTIGFGLEERPFSLKELAKRTGCGEKSVRKALQQLNEEGFLLREEREGQSSILGCRVPEPIFDGGIPGGVRASSRTPPLPRKERRPTPPPEGPPTPPSDGEGSYTWSCKSKELKSITSAAPQEDSVLSDGLTPLAEAVSQKLAGKTRRVIRVEEVLPTLRELRVDCLNRDLDVDLSQTVLNAIDYGLDANLRKNGASTIWSWQYFLPGLRDALEKAALEKRRRADIDELKRARALQEARQEKAIEDQVMLVREQWERLPDVERNAIERRVFSGLQDFIRTSVKRDRELNRRGPGIIALEQACLRTFAEETGSQSRFA